MSVLTDVVSFITSGGVITLERALELAAGPREDLFDTAEAVTRRMASRTFNLCGIINAKSGRCSENCRWCAQSRHWDVPGVAVYPIVGDDPVETGAKRALSMGVTRYSLVTSGRKPSAREIRELCDRVRTLKAAHPELEVCVSLGLLSKRDLEALRDAGVVRIHCNLETSRNFFPEVCTSHAYDEKIRTLRDSREAGLDICSGGLIGMGETLRDRIELALELRALDVPSIPINVLHPVAGTPLGGSALLPDEDFLVTAALFRLINPTAYLRFAGGRLQLSAETVREAARIGINAAISGDFLTTCGASPLDDARLFIEAGYEPEAQTAEALKNPQEGTLSCAPCSVSTGCSPAEEQTAVS
ncbi:biotin synthase BioB [Sutterella sp.]|uniref:biotin synthase BioB n=1 Tax=Sutterella sp. TaxID=1981025 RepID=UPI0026E07261|nr:biotin synthase BioB [Sutterella sp.]MDO5532431.1 biotin synthase BioB [Sutterella sp.]